MSDSFVGAMAELRKSASRLNSLADRAADVVKETEEFLNRYNIGVPEYVALKNGGNIFIGFRRFGQKFRICVVVGSPESPNARPWSDCTREEKMASFVRLPDLLVKISAKIESEAAKAEQAIAQVTRLLGIEE